MLCWLGQTTFQPVRTKFSPGFPIPPVPRPALIILAGHSMQVKMQRGSWDGLLNPFHRPEKSGLEARSGEPKRTWAKNFLALYISKLLTTALGRLLTFSGGWRAGRDPSGGEGQQPAIGRPWRRKAAARKLVYPL
jgi:hypothetical protein